MARQQWAFIECSGLLTITVDGRSRLELVNFKIFKLCKSANVVHKSSHPCRNSMQEPQEGCNLNPEGWGLTPCLLSSLCRIVA